MLAFELRGAFHRTHEAQHAVLSLPVGARVWLEREPTNRYDSNAVQVWNLPPDGPRDEAVSFLGYVPKEDAEDAHSYLLDGDNPYLCKVVELCGLKPKLMLGYAFEFEALPEEDDPSYGSDDDAELGEA